MAIGTPFNLMQWIEDHADDLKPPVSNKQFFTEADDVIIFVSGGGNTRNDYHVNPTEELFYQLRGDIAIRVRPLDGSEPQNVVVREGEMFLLPRWVPHRPQRPPGTIGLIVEFPRGDQDDALRWYCPSDTHLVYEKKWRLNRIDEDLAVIMEEFWGGPVENRTCKECGTVIERGKVFELNRE